MGVLLTTPVLGKEGGREARESVKNRHRHSRHHGHTDTRTDIDTHTHSRHTEPGGRYTGSQTDIHTQIGGGKD